MQLMKLERSICKLKESIQSTDVINFKDTGDKDLSIKFKQEGEKLTSGKIWPNKGNNFHLKDAPNPKTRSEKLGGLTAEIDTEKLYGRVNDKSEYTRFGISTYREYKNRSFKNDSGDDTLERASNPDINPLGINSSRVKNDPSLILEDEKARNSEKKGPYYKDRGTLKAPLY